MPDVRLVPLPKGGTLEIETTPAFYDALRKHLMLQPTQAVTDDHVRMFIFGVVSGAIDKAEIGGASPEALDEVIECIKNEGAE